MFETPTLEQCEALFREQLERIDAEWRAAVPEGGRVWAHRMSWIERDFRDRREPIIRQLCFLESLKPPKPIYIMKDGSLETDLLKREFCPIEAPSRVP